MIIFSNGFLMCRRKTPVEREHNNLTTGEGPTSTATTTKFYFAPELKGNKNLQLSYIKANIMGVLATQNNLWVER